MGGRDQEMNFGIGRITYTDLYNNAAERTIDAAIALSGATAADGPNKGGKFNLAHLPSDAVTAKDLGFRLAALTDTDAMAANTTYVITKAHDTAGENVYQTNTKQANNVRKVAGVEVYRKTDTSNTAFTGNGSMAVGDVIVVGTTLVADTALADIDFLQVKTGDHAFKAGDSYVITSLGSSTGLVADDMNDAGKIARAVSGISVGDTLVVGQKFTIAENASKAQLAHINSLTQNMTFTAGTGTLTKDIEAIQALVNTARVQAGSQYAAMESAVNYTTDLTAQYELGYNTVNDVNFSMETAHLAKNQILQQAATAMLAQANSGQQGLLQLIS